MKYFDASLLIVVLTIFITLLFPNNISKASQVDTEGNRIYDLLAKEYENDKSKLDKGESINKLELMFKGYALDAVDFTKENFKKQLDFSEKSIKDVEECLVFLNSTREQYIPSDAQILMTAKMYAGYIGQVIKIRWGGEWRDESEYSFNNGPALKVKEQHLFLLSKVYRRITGGAEDNIWHFYQEIEKDLEAK